nr:MAG TPA: hypothetical protein [Caudoviricetes sp.]
MRLNYFDIFLTHLLTFHFLYVIICKDKNLAEGRKIVEVSYE